MYVGDLWQRMEQKGRRHHVLKFWVLWSILGLPYATIVLHQRSWFELACIAILISALGLIGGVLMWRLMEEMYGKSIHSTDTKSK